MQTKTRVPSTSNKYGKKILTIPNILSFVRLAMIPLICYCYLGLENGGLTALLLTLSGLTDVLDGIIARKYNMISEFGKAFDPIADKLTQGCMLLCLISRFHNILFMVGLLLVKEVLNGYMNMLIAKRTGKVYGAEWHGKMVTVLLYLIMFAHLVWNTMSITVSNILIIVCCVVMLFSAVMYTIQNIKILKNK